MTKKKYTFIDLFAGIGGFHTAMHYVGGKCVFASEWDKNARLSYEANYKDIEPELFQKDKDGKYLFFNEDINDAIPNEIPDFDICCGGFPCQPFSVAGLKRGFEDTRGIIVLKRGEKKEEIGHLKKDFSPNMNDKASSLAAFSVDGKTLFELFEDDSYRSHSMNFIVHRGSGTLDGQEFSLQSDFPTGPDHPIPDNPRNRVAKIAIFNLKSNHVVGTTNSTWNDRITSVRITRQ